jgi:Na+/proline symporter
MKALMWIDVFQIMMMLIGLIASLVKGAMDNGGVEHVLETCWKGNRLELLEYSFIFIIYLFY